MFCICVTLDRIYMLLSIIIINNICSSIVTCILQKSSHTSADTHANTRRQGRVVVPVSFQSQVCHLLTSIPQALPSSVNA